MSRFTIPPKYYEGFKEYLKLDKFQRQNLNEQIKSAPSNILFSDLAKYLSSKEDSIGYETLVHIVDMLLSVLRTQPETGMSMQSFINDLKNTLSEMNEKDFHPDDSFESDLYEILTLTEDQKIVLKAEELGYDNDNILLSSRIISEVRPVFNEAEDLKISKLIITHKLKISHTNSSNDKEETYFTLSSDDLLNLKGLIDRALQKEIIIKESLGTSLKFIDIK